jgi:hypothetical protein
MKKHVLREQQIMFTKPISQLKHSPLMAWCFGAPALVVVMT